MRSISSTITRLAALKAGAGSGRDDAPGDRLRDLASFGSNPGGLRARTYIPHGLAAGSALVVALHGCTQTAAAYDRGSGWSQLAEREGFAVLFAEQQRSNNANLCFNWFVPSDTRRDSGEVLSIRQMVEAVCAGNAIDRERIFVTGLSAGGAMTCALLATYPDIFAGGAVIAGLAYGCAGTIPEALDRMRGHGVPDTRQLQARLAAASSHSGRWPTVSIWHGSADATVAPANADAIAAQWRKVHGVDATPPRTDALAGHVRRTWSDANGHDVIESVTISGMGHGAPIDPGGPEPSGQSGPFMIDAGVSSTRHIASFWGIAAPPSASTHSRQKRGETGPAPLEGEVIGPRAKPAPMQAAAQSTEVGIRKTIEDALRTAGLTR